ncbi:peptidoglycan-binding protein LysM [Ramlibacter sp.]|uniref:peptidoglycan-binding protein LysM n=1 Tax=Ramlibacter sp. TaxID=1917967 RepID=UPI002C3FD9D0|nr:peptidoglycan-binding protein LysM [Ramlibacter sp.]HWI81864.1 peptidoglycan-binding protein LysM [Ramlibacter sp.]
MSLLNFIRDAGEKLFKKPEATASAAAAPSAAAAAPAPESVDVLNARAGDAIEAFVAQQNLGIQNLDVKYDGATEKATISGTAPSQEAAEKAVLCCGNVAHVATVENKLTVPQGAESAQFHDVVKGDTLSAIAKKYYGDAGKYQAIFEANRPMLSDPDRIYPGQKLRIPKLA